MKVKIVILIVSILITSCSRKVCGGTSGKRCVDLDYQNRNNFIKNKSIV